MAGIPDWAKPVEFLETEEERVSRISDPLVKSSNIEVPEWAKPVLNPPVVSRDVPEWAKPVLNGEEVNTKGESSFVGLPSSVKAYTYSENDLSKNEDLYNPIFDYVKDRYGSQAVRGKDRVDVVNTFLNNRRGNASGNSVRALSEADYLIDIRNDNERLLKAGKAYAIFEGMQGITGEGVTWGETFSALGDYTRSVLLDPVNLATAGIGKIFGGTAIRAGAKSVEKLAMKEVSKQLINGATKEAAKKAGTEVLRKTTANAAVEGTAEIAQFAATMAANKGVSRVLTSAGLKEVGVATVVDAAINSGTEFLYQRSLVETNVQGGVSKSAVGIAALSSIAM
jgi:hypothetical protein